MLPLALDLTGRRVVMVGGGKVTARRVRAFLDAGAQVTVIAPELCPALQAMTAHISWWPRQFVDGDLAGAWLAHTATGAPMVDARVAAEAETARIWCINAGKASRGSAAVPARATVATADGDITVAVTSGDPRRSVAIRDYLVGLLPQAPLQAVRSRLMGRAA